MRTPLLTSLVLVPLLLCCGPVQAAPGQDDVPEARPVQLDGVPGKAEWSAARVLPLGEGGSEILLQQFRGTLMLALRSDRAWTPRSSLTLWLCPAGPKAGASGPGAVRITYEPFEHDREHVVIWRSEATGGWKRLSGVAVARHTIRAGSSALELALPLSALGLDKEQRPAWRACIQWARMGGKSLIWPQGLNLTATAGTMPPDLASAVRWGTLAGWGDPSGPGAFSKTEWSAMLARDREILEKGRTAHHAVNLLVEEWKKTKKRDKELVPQVLGALADVRRHERLTGGDLLAMATVLRYLNRHARARGILDALVDHPNQVAAKLAWRERALLFESMQRYDDAAADWRQLAELTGSKWGAAYERAAAKASARAKAWSEEAEARKVDEANAKLPRVALHTTHGVIEIVLYVDDVPDAVKHFLELVGSKFYDGTLFHRVQGDYLAQGGDPKSRDQGLEHAGSGSSSKMVPIEVNKRHDFWRGAVGFARGVSDYNGSQFFLMTGPRPKLGDYTCFGHIVRGQQVADRLEYGDTLLKAVVLQR